MTQSETIDIDIPAQKDSSVFFRMAQMREAMLYAETVTDRKALLCEWRCLELEMLDFHLKVGAMHIASSSPKQHQYLILASRLMFEIRKRMATFVGNEKILRMPFGPWNAETHFKLLPVNLALIVRLHADIASLDDAKKPLFHHILEWEHLCTLLMQALVPLLIVRQEFMVVPDTVDIAPGRDATFFNSVKLFPIEFGGPPCSSSEGTTTGLGLGLEQAVGPMPGSNKEELERVAGLVKEYTAGDFTSEDATLVETGTEKEEHDEEGGSSASHNDEKKRKQKEKKKKQKQKQKQKQLQLQKQLQIPRKANLYKDMEESDHTAVFNLEEVQAYMTRKWKELISEDGEIFIYQDGELVPFDRNDPTHNPALDMDMVIN